MTLRPARARYAAAVRPLWPPPTITTSWEAVEACSGGVRSIMGRAYGVPPVSTEGLGWELSTTWHGSRASCAPDEYSRGHGGSHAGRRGATGRPGPRGRRAGAHLAGAQFARGTGRRRPRDRPGGRAAGGGAERPARAGVRGGLRRRRRPTAGPVRGGIQPAAGRPNHPPVPSLAPPLRDLAGRGPRPGAAVGGHP